MRNCLSEHEIAACLNNKASTEHLIIWKRHLRVCDFCAKRLAEMRAGLGADASSKQAVSPPRNVTDFSHPMIGLEPNVQIGDFLIEKRLGSGGMGIVYQAMQVTLNRRVALKVLPLGLASDATAIERFHREARAAAKLHHPHIVPIYAEGIGQGVCYFAMEMVQGCPLDRVIQELRVLHHIEPSAAGADQARANGEVDILSKLGSGVGYFDTVARLMTDVADALEYAHTQGVVHRDIKPSNLMLADDGRLILTDFGLVHLMQEKRMTVTSSFIGTPNYMSPEQIRGTELDHRADIYSLGATLFELLTLETVFKGNSRETIISQILTKEPRRPKQINERVPVDLETICLKAMAKAPEKRYQTARALHDDLQRYLSRRVIHAKRAGPLDRFGKLIRRHKLPAALTAAIVVVAAVAGWLTWQYRSVQWAQQKAIPKVMQCIEEDRFYDALVLAEKVERYLPRDPSLHSLWPKFSRPFTIRSQPPGASVYLSKYFEPTDTWTYLGRTPLHHTRIPYGTFRWKVEKQGWRSLEVMRTNDPPQSHHQDQDKSIIEFVMHEDKDLPENMVWIPPSELGLRDLYHSQRTVSSAPAYLIDKYEVTHRQFKAFIDYGGYTDRRYWEHPFIRKGTELSWKEAMEVFRDKTGMPGPATWKNGTYPEGYEDYPVGGISWYEAAAYAKFKGKDLPTVFHWVAATYADTEPYRITNLSNFGDHSAPVGHYPGMTHFGLYDTAGNVREWCYNIIEGPEEQRSIVGGAWGEHTYMFVCSSMRSPWDRDQANGFRCVKYLGERLQVPQVAFEPICPRYRELSRFTPATDEKFQSILDTWYNYDKTDLNTIIESEDNTLACCKRQRVTFDAAYPNERMIAYLHIPHGVKPPYQPVIWYPGGGARGDAWGEENVYCREMIKVIESGRALVLPIYKGTYQRRLDKSFYEPNGIQSRNLYIQRSQDLRRTVDYLETRDDMDVNNLAFIGLSWGGQMGSVMMATEPRFRTGIFLLGGICACQRHPTSDPANFAPHVTVPILMINGSSDALFPYDTAQRPLYDLLGTPGPDKKHVIIPGGHGISWEYRKQYHKAILDWLDHYLGAVSRMQKSNTQTTSTVM